MVNSDIKEKALVRPTVEYASSVWDPHLQKDINKLEMIQRRSARYVTNRYHNTSSVETKLQKLQWPTLEERRKKARLILLYKVANGEVKIDAGNKLIPPDRLSRHTNAQSFQIPSCNTSIRKESFYPKTIRDWNNLHAQWPPQKVLTGSRDYCLHINLKSDVFICTCKKCCIAQTSFVTFGLFEYASAHQIQWQDSQPNDGGHLVVEVEVFGCSNMSVAV